MSPLVEFRLAAGGTVLVQVTSPGPGRQSVRSDNSAAGVTPGGLRDRADDLTERAAETLDAALGAVQPAAESLLSSPRRVRRRVRRGRRVHRDSRLDSSLQDRADVAPTGRPNVAAAARRRSVIHDRRLTAAERAVPSALGRNSSIAFFRYGDQHGDVVRDHGGKRDSVAHRADRAAGHR
jgi:hypothetical protein